MLAQRLSKFRRAINLFNTTLIYIGLGFYLFQCRCNIPWMSYCEPVAACLQFIVRKHAITLQHEYTRLMINFDTMVDKTEEVLSSICYKHSIVLLVSRCENFLFCWMWENPVHVHVVYLGMKIACTMDPSWLHTHPHSFGPWIQKIFSNGFWQEDEQNYEIKGRKGWWWWREGKGWGLKVASTGEGHYSYLVVWGTTAIMVVFISLLLIEFWNNNSETLSAVP